MLRAYKSKKTDKFRYTACVRNRGGQVNKDLRQPHL